MSWKENLRSRLELFGEFWLFLRRRKRYWLAPIIFVLLILGIFIVFLESSALAPFIYALF